MKIENYTTIILTAEEGYYLTQSFEVDLRDRIISTKVALGITSTKDDWKEISIQEGDQILEDQKKLMEEEEKVRETEENNIDTTSSPMQS